MEALEPLSVVIPTYQRDRVLLDCIDYLLRLEVPPAEILIVDQTPKHESATERELSLRESEGKIGWLRLLQPSVTHAMNVGIQHSQNEVVLFLDDDIIPGSDLIAAHSRAHAAGGCNIVAGQVLQPGEEPIEQRAKGEGQGVESQRSEVGGEKAKSQVQSAKVGEFVFQSNRRQYITELMGGNFSIKRDLALRLGGFDENFVHVAYRFEAEFAARALAAGEKILFEPGASIRHLKAASGGTRAYGNHLTTIKPSHAVGEYYYLLRAKHVPRRILKMIARPLRAIRTRHHLFHPWWIPVTLISETWGFLWAVALAVRGPKLIPQRSEVRGQRSEVRGQKSEVRGQRSDVRSQRSEVRSRKSEVRGQKSEVRSQRSEADV